MDWNLFLFEKEFLYIIIFKQMIDRNFLASFLTMYCKNSLLFKEKIKLKLKINNNNNNNINNDNNNTAIMIIIITM